MFAKKNCPKNEKLYIFKKALTMPFQICKNLQIFKFPLTGCLQKICNFFLLLQNLCNLFPYVKGFPKS